MKLWRQKRLRNCETNMIHWLVLAIEYFIIRSVYILPPTHSDTSRQKLGCFLLLPANYCLLVFSNANFMILFEISVLGSFSLSEQNSLFQKGRMFDWDKNWNGGRDKQIVLEYNENRLDRLYCTEIKSGKLWVKFEKKGTIRRKDEIYTGEEYNWSLFFPAMYALVSLEKPFLSQSTIWEFRNGFGEIALFEEASNEVH